MSENLALKMHETQAELEKIKEEMEEIQKQNTELRNPRNNSIGNEKQTILLLGGADDYKNLDTLLMLENNERNWKELNIKLPYVIHDIGAQFLNNNLYIFGGYKSNSTYKLSKSLQWEKMADMNQKHYHMSNSSVILNNQIWVCGGYDGREKLKSVEMYDPLTNKWKFMKEMNEDRADAAAAVVNGKIFCSGGYELKSVECYDPSSDVWTFICDMPQVTWSHGAVEMNGNLIVIGGYNFQYKWLKNVWALDTTDESAVWIEKSSMSIQRKEFSIAKIDDKIFVYGGDTEKDEIEVIDDVEMFDGEVWRKGLKMPSPREKFPAVVIPMQFARYLNGMKSSS